MAARLALAALLATAVHAAARQGAGDAAGSAALAPEEEEWLAYRVSAAFDAYQDKDRVMGARMLRGEAGGTKRSYQPARRDAAWDGFRRGYRNQLQHGHGTARGCLGALQCR